MRLTSVISLSLLCVVVVVNGDSYHQHSKVRGASTRAGPIEEQSQVFWNDLAQKALREKLDMRPRLQKAKNVIFFIGDGMSVATLAAARTLEGQKAGKNGEENKLSFEKFPVVGLSHTYCVNAQVADSACSATAYLGGVKGNDATAGVSAAVAYGDCDAMNNATNHVKSIANHAIDAGKSAGIVTTTRVTHASPSGAFAHIAARDWESDSNVAGDGEDPVKCRDIAYQLIKMSPGRYFKVILGGGRGMFLPRNASPEGRRIDGEDLTMSWKTNKENLGLKHEYVTTRQQLLDVNNDTEYLLGLFHASHMEYHMLANPETQPTLEEMTESAIKVLSKNDEGYFLFVEGGRIDHAHHDTAVHLALDETVELSKAVQRAAAMTSREDTLLVVTSDHAHTMTISGYPSRGNDILGANDLAIAKDGLPYVTLSYANGPGYRAEMPTGKRVDVTKEAGYINKDPKFLYPGLAPLTSETHGGEDVAVFAYGPWDHLFSGSYEQNFIPHMMSYALCVGPGQTACNSTPRK